MYAYDLTKRESIHKEMNYLFFSFFWSAESGAVKKLVNHICTKTGSKNRVVNVDFPLSGKQEVCWIHQY